MALMAAPMATEATAPRCAEWSELARSAERVRDAMTACKRGRYEEAEAIVRGEPTIRDSYPPRS